MYYMYTLEEFDYVSLYQNHLLHSIKGSVCNNNSDCELYSFDNLVINQGITQELLRFIIDHSKGNDTLIIDLRHMRHKPIHSLESIMQLTIPGQYKSILFISDNIDISKLIQKYLIQGSNLELHLYDKNGLCYLFGNREGNAKVQIKYPNLQTVEETIHNAIMLYIFSKLKTNEGTPWLIKSSNVYANRYFNAKKIFCEGSLFHLVTYQMAWIIKNITDSINAFDAFICASVNGACLASGLAVFFKKPVIFLRNVGPQMTTSDERLAERIISGKKYIYVFDFMCLGTEFQRIKMLTNIRKAQIISCIGISYYKYPEGEMKQSSISDADNNINTKSIHTLFYINQFEKDYYRCFAEQQDCIDFVKCKEEKGL